MEHGNTLLISYNVTSNNKIRNGHNMAHHIIYLELNNLEPQKEKKKATHLKWALVKIYNETDLK